MQATVTATLGLGLLGRPRMPLTFTNLFLQAAARITIGPLLPDPPCVARLSLTLLRPPLLGFSLGPDARPAVARGCCYSPAWT